MLNLLVLPIVTDTLNCFTQNVAHESWPKSMNIYIFIYFEKPMKFKYEIKVEMA